MTPIDLSVVIPFYNEEASAGALIDEVAGVLMALGTSCELVLVNDGSTDGTRRVLLTAQARWPFCRVLQLSRNAGQAAALWHGLHLANGRILATLDGDGQNDPADLPAMLQQLSGAASRTPTDGSGVDMVVGVRTRRQDSALRLTMSRVANGVRRRWLHDGVSDTGCALKVFRREVLASFLPVRTLYSFIPAFAAAAGFRIREYAVQHRPRQSGTSKYGLLVMLWRPMFDMLAIGWVLQRRIPRVEVEEAR